MSQQGELGIEMLTKEFKGFVASMSLSPEDSQANLVEIIRYMEQFSNYLLIRKQRVESQFVKISEICLKRSFLVTEALTERNKLTRKDQWQSFRSISKTKGESPVVEVRTHTLGGALLDSQFIPMKRVVKCQNKYTSTVDLLESYNIRTFVQEEAGNQVDAYLNTFQFRLNRIRASSCRETLFELEEDFYSCVKKVHQLAREDLRELGKIHLDMQRCSDGSIHKERVLNSLRRDQAQLLEKVRSIVLGYETELFDLKEYIKQSQVVKVQPKRSSKRQSLEQKERKCHHQSTQTGLSGRQIVRRERELEAKEGELQQVMAELERSRDILDSMMAKAMRLQNSGVELLEDVITSVTMVPLEPEFQMVYASNLVKLFEHYGIRSNINLGDVIEAVEPIQKARLHRINKSYFQKYRDDEALAYQEAFSVQAFKKNRNRPCFLPNLLVLPTPPSPAKIGLSFEYAFALTSEAAKYNSVETEVEAVASLLKDINFSNQNSFIKEYTQQPAEQSTWRLKKKVTKVVISQRPTPERRMQPTRTVETKSPDLSAMNNTNYISRRKLELKKSLPTVRAPAVAKMDVFDTEGKAKFFEVLRQPVKSVRQWLEQVQPAQIPIQIRTLGNSKDLRKELDKLIQVHSECEHPCVHLGNFVRKLNQAKDRARLK